ncbi:MAG: glycosyltransferase family 2 protein [Bacteroidota bacterium]|nr:glycosyltransferase family 2 protein [Bacteroidota bacterium]
MQVLSVAAVVLNWNQVDETIECVKSLLESSHPDLKIVIVDNASSDDSVEVLAKTFPLIPLIQNSRNAGYAGGNNLGIKWAIDHDAEYVLVLNNDVTVDKQLVKELLATVKKNDRVGIVTSKVYYKDDPERIFSGAGKIIHWRCTGVNRGKMFGRFSQHNTEHLVDYICGVLFLARVEVFKTIGLLDERFFMYFEDLEFSMRVSSKYLIAYTPKAIAYHKSGGGTRWSNYSEVYLYYQTRNRFWVFEKEPTYYRMYVIMFTLFITIAKSIAILFSVFERKGQTWKQLNALWKGLKDGMKILLFGGNSA